MSGPPIPKSMLLANVPVMGLPQLLPDPAKSRARSGKTSGVQAGKAAADPCGSVTRSTITGLHSKIQEACVVAQTNANANGEGVPGAENPAAATYSLTVLTLALDGMEQLHLWLDTNGLYVAPDDRVTNASAAFNSSRNTAPPARDCVERVSEALSLLDPLAANATRCYLSAYFS
ncbi:hypothetical protein JYJ95_12770 [Corallococcus exiguus]|uniref:hypothetical protein n=1 Tax=Corallococcus exiguus TaxID=83462 RepID=UPI001A8DB648|nr:hypothetical protein [Corallococcus exiguus]MBN8467389.1 hypothetical protein [Corallococcus exiguus]